MHSYLNHTDASIVVADWEENCEFSDRHPYWSSEDTDNITSVYDLTTES